MSVLYAIGIRCYYLAILLASFWNQKARQWLRGRKNWYEELKNSFEKDDRIIWFHCASLGEFEQGRPLIEKVKTKLPDKKILLSFYSPSGYEKRKNFEAADYVCYLPLDTRRNARKMLDLVHPEKVVFIKYEFWRSFLYEINKRRIPLFLASGSFYSRQSFFKPWGAWFRKLLYLFNRLYVLDRISADLLDSIGFTNYEIAGDTRFDRVLEIANKHSGTEMVFPENRLTLVAGSTWPEDEEIICASWSDTLKLNLIIAPHEPSEAGIDSLKEQYPGYVLYSQILRGEKVRGNVILVDTIGHLSSLYRFGSIAFIGGGFGKGIHNILEAAAFGLPVIFGPNYQRFSEARELLSLGGAHTITTTKEFLEYITSFKYKPDLLKKESDLVRNYTRENSGATNHIFEKVFGT